MRSFILSIVLSFLLAFFFMSIFDTKISTWYRKLPDWFFIAAMAFIFLGYLLSLYWGITGIKHGMRLFNVLGIGISLTAICIYAVFYFMDKNGGKEKEGQFDHDLAAIEVTQRTALNDLLLMTGTRSADVKIIAYWKMNRNPGDFVICIQKGNVIALQVKNKTVINPGIVSTFKHLNWLVLENCNLRSVADLDLPLLQRLSIRQNQVTSLAGLEHSPQLGWLNYYDNPVKDSSALNRSGNKQLYIVNE